jgi:hypothetical protein
MRLPPRRLRLVLRAALTAALLTPAAWLAAPSPARASLVLAMDLPDLVEAADRVVVGEVTSVTCAWSPDRRRILTTVELSVGEAWKGAEGTSRRVTLVQAGGVVGDIEMRVHGMPAFAVGERSVLFLAGAPARVVGLGQGRRLLRFDRSAGRWMVDGGDRSAAVARALDGALIAAPAVPSESLDDLRARVRGLVVSQARRKPRPDQAKPHKERSDP